MATSLSRSPLSYSHHCLPTRSQIFNHLLSKPHISPRGCSSSLSYKGLSLSVKASAAATSVNSTVVEKRDKRIDDPIIVIDNYDSFTYNLCQYMGELGCLFEVYRNDELSVDELKRKNPRGVLISPGPGVLPFLKKLVKLIRG